ncbi:MAG: hypothetical protein K2I62_02395, partial [Alistipes sp.]|nr:hypothetical protein [Alistipes sp.]
MYDARLARNDMAGCSSAAAGGDASKMRVAADGNARRCKQTYVRHREELKELYPRLLLQRVECVEEAVF